MPLYDYECNDCGNEVELFHGMNETRRKCPECGKLQLKRAFKSAPAYHDHYSPMHPRAGRGRGGWRGLPGD
jgi:putative FmdB family regulatory protein